MSEQRYTGYLRFDGSAWQAVVQADDESECWRRLLDVPHEGRSVSRCVRETSHGLPQAYAATMRKAARQ